MPFLSTHLAVCRTRLDLAILIDASQKPLFTDINFRRYIQFIKRLISGFNIGQYGTHVGLAVFYQDTNVIFGFQRYYNLWTLLKAINGIRFSQRGARLGKALEEVRNKLFGASARPGVPKMLLVMTDTVSQVSLYSTKPFQVLFSSVIKLRKSWDWLRRQAPVLKKNIMKKFGPVHTEIISILVVLSDSIWQVSRTRQSLTIFGLLHEFPHRTVKC